VGKGLLTFLVILMDNIFSPEKVVERNYHYFPEGCTKCPLHESRTNIVWCSPSDPVPTAKILIIGEGPGEQEDLQGRPFVGRSGELLNQALSKAFNGEYFWTKVYITNVVKCRPPGNRNPTREEMEACYPNLQVQYTLQYPEIIVALGKVAAEFLLQRPVKITKEHGNLDFINERPVLICYHPAYVLRNRTPEIRESFFQAIQDARSIAYGISDTGIHERSFE
jgi:uracil-DNA glycosylase